VKLSGDVALFRLDNKKANAIDAAFLDQIERLPDQVESIGARAIVITGYDRYFSAGLALPQLVSFDREAMRGFITRFSEVMLALYACPLPVVAAVNGHAVAGGCVLSLMADVRVMVEDAGKIGLNEVQLGIGLPASVVEPLRATVPASSLRPIAMEGRLFTPPEALALGLVDELWPAAELEKRAIDRAQAMASLSPLAFAQVKRSLRAPVLEYAARVADEQTERWLDGWCSEPAQRRIGELVASL